MAGFLSPFTCPQLNVNNTFFVNNTIITFGGIGTAAPVLINTTAMVINAVGGRINIDAISIKTSNQSTFFANLNSPGLTLSHPSISTTLTSNQVDCVEGVKEYHINQGRFEVVNSIGFAFSANITEVRVGSASTPNVAKLTSTKLSLRNDNTYISTTGLAINNQSLMNVTTLSVTTVSANFVTLDTGARGNASGLSLFSTTANGVAPQTNTRIGNNYLLHANGDWYPPGLLYVASGNLQGTPSSPNVKAAEITWANTFGDVYIEGWFLPQNNVQDLLCYLQFNGNWVNTGADYHRSFWYIRQGTLSAPGGVDDADFIEVASDVSNNANRPTFVKVLIHESRSSDQIWMNFDSVGANSSSNNLPFAVEGWGVYRSGDSTNANGVTGIRFYFPSGNIATARWTVKALHSRQDP